LHYHPSEIITGSDTAGGKDLEFIEFKNTGQYAVNMSGLALDTAVHYRFQEGELLPPGRFFVVVSKPSKFYDYYGLLASGNFSGNFSNAGEEVVLGDSLGHDIMRFTYGDSYPWPGDADGEGYSLSSQEISPSGNPSDFAYWTLSVKKDGTPFADNILQEDGGSGSSGGLLSVYPNPTEGLIRIQLEQESGTPLMEVYLYSTTGRLILHETLGNPGLLDLSGYRLPAGVYILKAATSDYSARIPVILTRK